jgi:hypothetical protein
MAKYNPAKRSLDEQELEGSGGGGGIGGTKWSSMPSFKGNSNLMDDLKKIGKDTSNLKGGAKKSAEDAQDRAIKRTATRAAGAGATDATINAATGDDSSDVTEDSSSPSSAGMGEIMSGKGMKKGGMTASSRADGIAQRGKTRGKYL